MELGGRGVGVALDGERGQVFDGAVAGDFAGDALRLVVGERC